MSRHSLTGQTLGGRYRMDELIGQGGMSAVYKAYDPNLKRVVAVKTIHSHLAEDPKFLARFEEEAAAVAQLRHPNIVQVFDFNHDDDLYFMVQEFLAGETLQTRLRRLNQQGRRMPPAEAIGYTLNICEATAYAHRRGMIHRDIKPANIMLDIHGQAILMDFGIVKITGSTSHTATGAVVGTALYISPELIRGETPDPRSDEYSLGVTLYEMLNGRPPFEADSAMTLMMMHLNDPLPDMRQLRPDAPEALISVVERSLAKNPQDRFASMGDFAAALKDAQIRFGSGIAAAATLADQRVVETGPEATPTPPATAQDTISETKPAEEAIAAASLAAAATAVEPRPARPESQTAARVDSPTPSVSSPPPSSPTTGTAEPPGGSAVAAPGGTGSSLPPPAGAALSTSEPRRKAIPPWIWIATVTAIVLVAAALFIGSRLGGSGEQTTISTTPTSAEAAAALPTAANTATLEPTPQPTASETLPATTPTATLPPSQTPTPTLPPTPTVPPGVPFSLIKSITVDSNQNYVVEYETFEYTEGWAGTHVHFFFNDITQEQAGNPGSGPWYMWGGPRPFTEYRLSQRPENAGQMCILVANPDHSVQLNSGNCVPLPDVVSATVIEPMYCYTGPAMEYPTTAMLSAGQTLLVKGISPDEQWWNVVNPANITETCWLPQNLTIASGDFSTLPLAEVPPLPTSTVGSELSIEIMGITIDDQNHYVVDYQTNGFTEQLPGTHMHFFFDTVPPDQVGMSGGGSRLMWGGPNPFTSYLVSDRPAEAKQMCVLVANPDHSVVQESGNCFALPDVAP